MYGHFFFEKEAKTTQWWSAYRRMLTDPFLSPSTMMNSKWIKGIHIKPDTLKVIEEKVEKSLKHISTEGNFLNRKPMAYTLRSTIDKWDLIK